MFRWAFPTGKDDSSLVSLLLDFLVWLLFHRYQMATEEPCLIAVHYMYQWYLNNHIPVRMTHMDQPLYTIGAWP